MAKERHLTNPPVIEAILVFQADVSRQWDPLAIRDALPIYFPAFSQVQEQREFENEVTVTADEAPRSKVTVSQTVAFILHTPDGKEAIQIRRDGFAFSTLQHYPGWDQFSKDAILHWNVFKNWLGVESAHMLFARFINRMFFPREGFRLSEYFNHTPKAKGGDGWGLKFFREHYLWVPPGNHFSVESIFSRGPQSDLLESTLAFDLELAVSPFRPLPESGETVESILPELRKLKNKVFFSKFKEKALKEFY